MRRRLLVSLASLRAPNYHHHQQLPLSSLLPPFSPLRAMSAAVAEAPPAVKKSKTAYGEHTREVRSNERD